MTSAACTQADSTDQSKALPSLSVQKASSPFPSVTVSHYLALGFLSTNHVSLLFGFCISLPSFSASFVLLESSYHLALKNPFH